MVEIEIFSYCNRRCWFCPNSKVDRISQNVLMPAAMYSRIIDQLAEISFDGVIAYSRYNEPLSDRIILDRLREAQAKVPMARLHTNTNGDYLDHDYVRYLYDAGMRSLNVQLYLKNDERYDHEQTRKKAALTLKRINLPHVLTRDEPGVWLEYAVTYKDMSIRVYGRNFAVNGTNRGGQVDIMQDYVRTAPCLMPFWSVYVDYNGLLMPCCNLRSDVPEHRDYVLGDMAGDGDLFLHYTSRQAALFRKSLLNHQVKEGVCQNCHFAVPDINQDCTDIMDRLSREAEGEMADTV
ncbi:radical SAM/SPASM domain-containing protein [Niveispirillum sp. SYP-B3756]|uniref:radical SAM/SPASM domain-containing protein n=1 Tax=Niveispirillum sp. SYP-B3756 TaxID=2662178 RepID=UPI0032B4984A